MVYLSENVEQTEAIAGEFARSLQPGACIALDGDLGAGKTQFVRGMIIGLGGDGRAVSSPTYVLLHVYSLPKITLYHLDAYRVQGADDFEQIGFEELLDERGIVVVEWPSRVARLMPPATISVSIETLAETARRISISLLSPSGKG